MLTGAIPLVFSVGAVPDSVADEGGRAQAAAVPAAILADT